eukprot:498870_1
MTSLNTEIIQVNVNNSSVHVYTGQFPQMPAKWTSRLDIKIWNELSSACNNIKRNASVNRSISMIVSCTFWWVFIIIAIYLISKYYEGYGLGLGYGGEDFLILSSVFWAFAGCICVFFMPCSIYYDCVYKKKKNLSIEAAIKKYITPINEKYENMMICKVITIKNYCCQCPACCGCVRDAGYFELEIELKVQQLQYIEDIQSVGTLATQQQVMLPTPGVTLTMNPVQPTTNPVIDLNFNQRHYTQWTTNNVFNFIMSLDNGAFRIYEQTLRQNLQNEGIDGNDICDLDKDDFHRLGVQNFKLKKSLMTHIQSLSNPVVAYQTGVELQTTIPSALDDNVNPIKIVNNTQEGGHTVY